MPGSFIREIGPVPMATKRALKRSPRLVSMTQREDASSHTRLVTLVEKSALSVRSKVSAMRLAWSQISLPKTYFLLGM
jgi:hypothetical protein